LKKKEALSLHGIGQRLATQIWEIIEYGDSTKLNVLNSRDDINALKLFTNCHGIGPTTAASFVSQVNGLNKKKESITISLSNYLTILIS
jgi:DNA polymerase/3'-5' exonuclease PolX